MTVAEILGRLASLGNAKIREQNGVGANQFGVKKGDLRPLAKEIKPSTALAHELWATGNHDARLLATLLIRPKELSAEELEVKVRETGNSDLADWLNSYVVKAHPEKEALREKWLSSGDPMLGRAAWSLTAERVSKNPDGLDLPGLLDRIEAEMAGAPALVQWTMNYTLAEIGINFAEYRERALGIGERLGVYRDYPTSKGCTSPFAPLWINEMVRRNAG